MHLPLYSLPSFPIPYHRFDVGYYVAMNPDCQANRASDVYDYYLQHQGRAHQDEITIPLNVKHTRPWIGVVSNNLIFERDDKLSSSIVRWCTLNRLSHTPFEMPTQFNLMLDFSLFGGTYTYSQFLESQLSNLRSLIRLIGFEHQYISVLGSHFMILSDVMSWIKAYAPRANLFFANHWLGTSSEVIQALLTHSNFKVTVLHDIRYQQPFELLLQYDLVIAQSQTVADLSRTHFGHLPIKQVSHPDYFTTEGSFTYTKTGRRIALIGAISPMKGLKMVETIKQEGYELCVIGTCNGLESHPYESISDFNHWLMELQPSLLWFHNDITVDHETWCYALTLGILTGIPIVANNSPVFHERLTGNTRACFYQDNPRTLLQKMTPAISCNLIKDEVQMPAFYRKLFHFDYWCVQYKWLNRIDFDIDAPIKNVWLQYLQPTEKYVPLPNEFDPTEYRRSNPDLTAAGITTDDQLEQHYRKFGRSEGRFCNGYGRLNQMEWVIRIYRWLSQQQSLYRQQSLNCGPHNKFALVFFDTRKNQFFEWVTRNVVYWTKGRANLYIFAPADVIPYYQSKLSDYQGVKYIVQDYPVPFHIDDYNRMMKDISFWSQINEEHILTYQTDGFYLGEVPLDALIDNPHGYLGAWHYNSMFGQFDNNTPKGYGMNGGFSYRRKSWMINILRQVNDHKINEYRANYKFYPYGQVSEDSFYYHAVEFLGWKKATKEQADRWFLQDKMIEGQTPFSYHGITYGFLNLEEFYNKYCT